MDRKLVKASNQTSTTSSIHSNNENLISQTNQPSQLNSNFFHKDLSMTQSNTFSRYDSNLNIQLGFNKRPHSTDEDLSNFGSLHITFDKQSDHYKSTFCPLITQIQFLFLKNNITILIAIPDFFLGLQLSINLLFFMIIKYSVFL